MVRAVIFDIDGTLIDSVDFHAKAWHEAFRHYGFDIPFPRVREQIGKGSDQLLPALLPKEAVEEKGRLVDKRRGEIFKREYLPVVQAFPGVRELFERIRAGGAKIVLASSAKGDELETYKKITRVGDLIAGATSSDDADKSKPHPDIFEAALKILPGVDRADIIVVGDTPYDVEAATKAKLRSLGVTCGGWPASKLRSAGCVAVYRDPAEMLQEFAQSPLAGDERVPPG